MKSLSKKYKGALIFATLLNDNLTSVWAQLDDGKTISKNIYEEKIYRTNNLSGAIEHYIKTYLEKVEISYGQ